MNNVRCSTLVLPRTTKKYEAQPLVKDKSNLKKIQQDITDCCKNIRNLLYEFKDYDKDALFIKIQNDLENLKTIKKDDLLQLEKQEKSAGLIHKVYQLHLLFGDLLSLDPELIEYYETEELPEPPRSEPNTEIQLRRQEEVFKILFNMNQNFELTPLLKKIVSGIGKLELQNETDPRKILCDKNSAYFRPDARILVYDKNDKIAFILHVETDGAKHTKGGPEEDIDLVKRDLFKDRVLAKCQNPPVLVVRVSTKIFEKREKRKPKECISQLLESAVDSYSKAQKRPKLSSLNKSKTCLNLFRPPPIIIPDKDGIKAGLDTPTDTASMVSTPASSVISSPCTTRGTSPVTIPTPPPLERIVSQETCEFTIDQVETVSRKSKRKSMTGSRKKEEVPPQSMTDASIKEGALQIKKDKRQVIKVELLNENLMSKFSEACKICFTKFISKKTQQYTTYFSETYERIRFNAGKIGRHWKDRPLNRREKRAKVAQNKRGFQGLGGK